MNPQHIQSIATVLQQPVVRHAPSGDTMKRGCAYPPPCYPHWECVAYAKRYMKLSDNDAEALVKSLEAKHTITRWSNLLKQNINVVLSHRVVADILDPQPESAMAA